MPLTKFVDWYKDAARTIPWNFSTDTVTANTTLYAKWDFQYDLGDTGPGSGIVFYRIEAGFTFSTSDTDTMGITCYYLEADLTDLSGNIWASSSYEATMVASLPATGMAIGYGMKNSQSLVNLDVSGSFPAAEACLTRTSGGKTDWFLPSVYELQELYNQRALFTGPSALQPTGYYLTSNPSDNGISSLRMVWVKSFDIGTTASVYRNSTSYPIRPIRAF
jgi:uncharacterized repeat protein (TIGR02543 family)